MEWGMTRLKKDVHAPTDNFVSFEEGVEDNATYMQMLSHQWIQHIHDSVTHQLEQSPLTKA